MRSHPFTGFLTALAFCVLLTSAAHAEDWPCWRGPSHNGISAEKSWAAWGAGGPKIAWKAQVGAGFSTFVVAGGRVITLGFADDADTLVCFETATGKQVWKHSYPSQLGDKFYEGGTTGTPTIDGERVYSLSRWGDLFCLEAATGKIIWSKNIAKEHTIRIPGWGFTGAPFVHENVLVLNAGDAGLGLDKNTGKLLWQSANKDAGYSTPYPVKLNGELLTIFGSAQSYVAVNPLTGKEAWRIRWVTQYGVNAADPVVDGERIFISSGYNKGAALFDTATPPKELWKSKALRTQMNGAVLSEGHLYAADGDSTEKGALKCIELATGTEKWAHPRFGPGSLIIADGKLIALSASGELSIAPASPQGFKPVATAQILGGKCWSAPVLSDGRLFCRNWNGQVLCIDLRK